MPFEPGRPSAHDDDSHALDVSCVSVVVCCRDRAGLLLASLPALTAALRAGDELIVVDSASRTAEVVLAAESFGVRVLRSDLPGASRARNVGLGAARNPVVAFVDDDCRPEPGWLDAVATRFATDASLGFSYGAVIPDGDGVLSVTTKDKPLRFAPGDVRVIDEFGHGANLSCRRDALIEVGGWEPRLGAGAPLRGGEDADVALRLLRAGYAGGFEPTAAVVHGSWRGRVEIVQTMYGYGMGAGAVALRSRWEDGDWWLLRHELINRGIRQVMKDARNGYQLGIIVGIARFFGVLVGAVRMWLGMAAK